MALIIEDGTGKADAEAYRSVTDHDTYHSNRGNSSWTGTDAVKEQAIRKAVQYLEGEYGNRWPGYKSTLGQARDWPRVLAYDSDGYLLNEDGVPTAIQDAESELAVVALTADLSPALSLGAIVRQKVGPIETEYDRAVRHTVYRKVEHILVRLIESEPQLQRA